MKYIVLSGDVEYDYENLGLRKQIVNGIFLIFQWTWLCEGNNELSICIKIWEILGHLGDSWFLKKDVDTLNYS